MSRDLQRNPRGQTSRRSAEGEGGEGSLGRSLAPIMMSAGRTDKAALDRIAACAKACEPACETLINYKKGGTKFVNQVHIQPVFDENDELAAFMSMLTEVDECALPPLAPVR